MYGTFTIKKSSKCGGEKISINSTGSKWRKKKKKHMFCTLRVTAMFVKDSVLVI